MSGRTISRYKSWQTLENTGFPTPILVSSNLVLSQLLLAPWKLHQVIPHNPRTLLSCNQNYTFLAWHRDHSLIIVVVHDEHEYHALLVSKNRSKYHQDR
jgi:hypothetical protein